MLQKLLKEQFKKLQKLQEVADKITSAGKAKSKEIYTPPGKRQQIIDALRLYTSCKNGIPKIINLLDTATDNVPRFITKNGQDFMICLEGHAILTRK